MALQLDMWDLNDLSQAFKPWFKILRQVIVMVCTLQVTLIILITFNTQVPPLQYLAMTGSSSGNELSSGCKARCWIHWKECK